MSLAEATKIANLKPAFFVHLDAAEPKSVLSNKSLSEVVVMVEGGYTKTLDESYSFDTTVEFGWDTLRTNTSTPETTSLDCHLFLTNKKGEKLHMTYSGVVVGTQKQVDVITKKSDKHDYTESYVTMHPTLIADDGVEVEAWSTKKNMLGKGRFIRDATGKLGVEYYVYVLE